MGRGVLLAFLIFVFGIDSSCGLEAKVWQNVNGDFNFADSSVPAVSSRPSTGISLSGGGSRAYIASMGYLSALHKLGLIENVRYIIGVSGGSWATAVYSYYSNSSVNDTRMLGSIVRPGDIEYDQLQSMDEACVRSYTATQLDEHRRMYTVGGDDDEGVYYNVWADSVQKAYLEPAGIERHLPFTFDEKTEADIKERNAVLKDSTFQTLRGHSRSSGDGENPDIDARPLPIFSATMVGPLEWLPYTPSDRNYSILEVTPLSAGVAFTRDIAYHSNESATLTVGGMVETFAFGGLKAPSEGMPADAGEGSLDVPDTDGVQMDINQAISASSFYSGCNMAASNSQATTDMAGTVNYWSPALSVEPARQACPHVIADGGGLQVTNMISLLQRGVRNIVMFVSSSVPMQDKNHWNPAEDELSETHIDFTVPAFFGQVPKDITEFEDRSYDVSHSQVFAEEEWLPLIQALQDAQQLGRGIIARREHTTIANEYFGIPAGQRVAVVWVYLGRLGAWEAALTPEMQALVVPHAQADNYAHLRESGPFEKFPNYVTDFTGINYERANLLADMAGWSILENAAIFEEILSVE
mmetsp:Transcript_111/g.186  ORF Transcript_111/g.186 Transcript_111/m.186 type:complete len:583 (-) Transcript_111:1474-3222(-)